MDINSLIRENIRNLQPYSSARDEFKDASLDMIFLDANENPFNTGLNRYPDPQQNLVKDALAKIKGVAKEQILLGNGSDEVLDLLFRVFCEPREDAIIILPPTYGMYSVLANTNAIDIVNVPLNESFQPDVNAILGAQHAQTKLLFLCSPNNPTANSFEAERIETLIRSFEGIVVIDEAYIDFSTQKSWVSRLSDFPNLVVTQTLSKAFGLAGIRLGVCYASQEIISTLNKVKPPYNVNQLTQTKALETLGNISKTQQEIDRIKAERNRLVNDLEGIDLVDTIFPSDANFVLARVDDADLRYEQLIQKGIVVRNRTNQAGCTNCLRFTVGTEEENNQLINALNEL